VTRRFHRGAIAWSLTIALFGLLHEIMATSAPVASGDVQAHFGPSVQFGKHVPIVHTFVNVVPSICRSLPQCPALAFIQWNVESQWFARSEIRDIGNINPRFAEIRCDAVWKVRRPWSRSSDLWNVACETINQWGLPRIFKNQNYLEGGPDRNELKGIKYQPSPRCSYGCISTLFGSFSSVSHLKPLHSGHLGISRHDENSDKFQNDRRTIFATETKPPMPESI
jgi:hypothetical protein